MNKLQTILPLSNISFTTKGNKIGKLNNQVITKVNQYSR